MKAGALWSINKTPISPSAQKQFFIRILKKVSMLGMGSFCDLLPTMIGLPMDASTSYNPRHKTSIQGKIMKKSKNDEFGPWEFLILALSVFVLVELSLGIFFHLTKGTTRVLGWSDLFVCVFFMADFGKRLFTAESKREYLKWGWIDFISSIPAIPFFQWGRIAQVVRVLRVLRGVRSIKEIFHFVYGNKALGTSVSAAIIAFVLLFSCSVAALKVEVAPESNIKTPSDAMWWAMSTMTTVGYGDGSVKMFL